MWGGGYSEGGCMAGCAKPELGQRREGAGVGPKALLQLYSGFEAASGLGRGLWDCMPGPAASRLGGRSSTPLHALPSLQHDYASFYSTQGPLERPPSSKASHALLRPQLDYMNTLCLWKAGITQPFPGLLLGSPAMGPFLSLF